MEGKNMDKNAVMIKEREKFKKKTGLSGKAFDKEIVKAIIDIDQAKFTASDISNLLSEKLGIGLPQSAKNTVSKKLSVFYANGFLLSSLYRKNPRTYEIVKPYWPISLP